MLMRVLMLSVVLLAGGCAMRLPRLPVPVDMPGVSVTGVRLVETGARASRYDIAVSLYNPNNFPLPVSFAEYELSIGGSSYKTDLVPSVVLPALGRMGVTLPAVLVGGEGPQVGGSFETNGRFTITPAGEFRRLMYEIGLPKPKAPFAARGEVGK